MKNKQTNEVKENNQKEIEFDERDLEEVDITNDELEKVDTNKQKAQKKAKKNAKEHRSDQEKKRSRRKKYYIAGLIVIILLGILAAIPLTRWSILNFIGFKSTVVINLSEQSDGKPISNASVMLDDIHFSTTDAFGYVVFSNVKYGKQPLQVKKVGYSTVETVITNGFGTTEVPVSLKVIGIKMNVAIKDWLSVDPLANVEVSSGEAKTISDKDGNASLVVPPTEDEKISITISAPGYHEKVINSDTSVTTREVLLVAADKDYFISNRDGKYDIFSSNLDGSAQQKIIEATGKESSSLLQFSIHRSNKRAILVANREGRSSNNRVVAGIYMIDLEKSTLQKIDEGSDVRLIDWAQDSIVYQKTDPGLPFDDPNLSRIVTYSVATSQLNQVAQANYFPALTVAQSKIFYMPTDPYRTLEGAAFTSFAVDTNARQTYLEDKQVNYSVQASYRTLELQTSDTTKYELQVGSGAVRPIDKLPEISRSFALNSNGSEVMWADRRDGQGTLLVMPTAAGGAERVVAKTGGLTNPVRYISTNLAVVRVVTDQESADYVVHLPTGKFAKIVDVAANVGMFRRDTF